MKKRKTVQQHLQQLAQFTATPGAGVTRLSYSDEDMLARNYLKQQMSDLGLQVREDSMGNIYGRLAGRDDNLPVVMIGSHFDSVPNGGAFDGAAGVVMGLEVAARFVEQNLQPHYPLEIVALVEEEGASFGSALLASRAIVGQVSTQDLHRLKNSAGLSVAECMAKRGFNADDIAQTRRDKAQIKAFLELHIEPGPVLENAQQDVGLVDVIVGISQLVITVEGKAGHAGTTPMDQRADALLAAIKIIQQIPQFAISAGESTVATVGKLQLYPNGANVIPSKVVFSVDIRSKNESKLQQVIDQVKSFTNQQQTSVIKTGYEQLLFVKPTRLSSDIFDLMQVNSDQLGLKSRTMVSGAGHDAMVFAGMTDVGLLFVPSHDGLSHHPDEWTDYQQIDKGIDVIFATVKQLTQA